MTIFWPMNLLLKELPKRDAEKSKLPGLTHHTLSVSRAMWGRSFQNCWMKPPSNPLHKLFTRQTVKLSYKCMPNMAQAVSRQNKKLLNEESQQLNQPPQCNCQGRPATCPVEGELRTNCVVYRATIKETASGNVETYTGMTGREFKDRWREHKYDIRNPSDKQKTRLSTHTWKLKDKSIDFDVKWSLIEHASDYNPITRKCRVCLKEKFYIMYDQSGSTLNKRQEVFNTCRHRKKKLLENFKT